MQWKDVKQTSPEQPVSEGTDANVPPTTMDQHVADSALVRMVYAMMVLKEPGPVIAQEPATLVNLAV